MTFVTFGELMLRLAPEGYLRFAQADRFGATYGGSEANVAVSLALLGGKSVFVTKLPRHEIGEAAMSSLRKFGVDTGKIVRGGERVGLYYLEKGVGERPSKVIYDRKNSAFAEISDAEPDWDKIFDGADYFHFTGITPSLSEAAHKATLSACKTARARKVTVSCDLNYRATLWTRERAGEVMSSLMPYVDICIANDGSAYDVFGIEGGNEVIARELTSRFGFKYVALTNRQSLSASDNNWSATLFSEERSYISRTHALRIVDRVGGGDAFAAGLLFALSEGYGPQKTIEFAAASGAMKHTVEGDFNIVAAEEIERLAHGEASGRVRR